MEMLRQERAMKQAEEQESASSALEEVSNSSDEVHDSDPNDTVECSSSLSSRKRLRASRKVITPKLGATLDRSKLSDRKATFVIAETAKSLEHDISDFFIKRGSVTNQTWRAPSAHRPANGRPAAQRARTHG